MTQIKNEQSQNEYANSKKIQAVLGKLQREIFYSVNMGIELITMGHEDPEFVKKLEKFLDECYRERNS
jgi:chitinase